MPGLKSGRGEKPIDRLGARHLCIFDEETFEILPLKSDIQDHEIRYIESSTGLESGVKYLVECRFLMKSENRTRVELKIGEEVGHPLVPEAMAMLLIEMRESAESFKTFCESDVN